MALELLAPAKVNLTLEVLGRRPDGYHEIVSLMQTIDLVDRVRLSPSGSLEIKVSGEQVLGVPLEGPRNLAYRAAVALAEAAGRGDLGARIELEKRIPAGMGLGGGSSDAAAVLRGLNRLWGLGLDIEALSRVAAGVSSDVTFFLHGGTALATGRGEQVEALPDPPAKELTLFVSAMEVEDKTRRMYATLVPTDWSDGHRSHAAAETLRRGLPLSEADLTNPFDRHIAEVAPPLARALALCRDAGLAVHACGGGPGFFSPTPLAEVPALLLRELAREWDVSPIACRGLSRDESLALRDV